jgi:RNA polymerase sigma factor (sigma-70 family)
MGNGQLRTVVHYLRCVAETGGAPTDAELLHAFAARRDESAFGALLRRHGPLVWNVCRHVLGHEQDAEDAFQATFLALARGAGTIREGAAVGSWLHGVALRVSLRARRDAARRRVREREAASMPRRNEPADPSWREVAQSLHEEVQALPEKYRAPFVLCVLQGESLAEAARQLGWKEGTVSGRLTRARQELRERLTRRGVELTALLGAASLARAAAPPARLVASTLRAAVASLLRGVTRAVLTPRRTLPTALLLLTLCGSAAVGLLARGAGPAKAPPKGTAGDAAAPAERERGPATLVLRGRVLSPEGKPVRGAGLYLLDFHAGPEAPKLRATTTADGRFRFTLARKEITLPPHWWRNPWNHVFLCAVADGYGPALGALGSPAGAKEHALRLAEDVVVRGRVLDLEGRLVPGATARVVGLGVPKGKDLTAFVDALRAGEYAYAAETEHLTVLEHLPGLAKLFPPAVADRSGRFRLKGVGRERLAIVVLSGPTVETQQVRVRTRPGKTIRRPVWKNAPGSGTLTFTYHGPTFDYVAGPTTAVVGVVRDRDTGKPIAGATVTGGTLVDHWRQSSDYVQARTDKEGRYRLVGLPRGGGNFVKVRGPAGRRYLPVWGVDVPAARGLESITLAVELKEGVRIRGRVTDRSTGKPVRAEVVYYPLADNPHCKDAPGLHPRVETDEDGTFEFVGLPGRGVVAVRGTGDRWVWGVGAERFKAGFRGNLPTRPLCHPRDYHALAEVNPAKGSASLECEVLLDPGRTLSGTVLGPDGKPLAGARLCGLRGFCSPYWERTPQPTAQFTAYGFKEGRLRNVLAVHEGRRLAGSLLVRGTEKGPLVIRLAPWGAARGRLVDADGQPRAGVNLSLRPVGDDLFDPQAGVPLDGPWLRTDRDGKFRADGLVPGLKYTLRVWDNPVVIGGTVFKDLRVKAGQTRDIGDVRKKK